MKLNVCATVILSYNIISGLIKGTNCFCRICKKHYLDLEKQEKTASKAEGCVTITELTPSDGTLLFKIQQKTVPHSLLLQ